MARCPNANLTIMIIKVTRYDKNDSRTISRLSIPRFDCYCIEDVDRGLTQDMPLEMIKGIKVYGKTAIPKGTYEVVISYSNRFKKLLPLLLNVPGFEGIRIHSGNTAADSDGCFLPGMGRSFDSVTESRKAMVSIMVAITKALKVEKVYLEVN